VAWHLSQAFANNGFKVDCIYSKTIDNARKLAEKINTKYSNNFFPNEIASNILIVCVADDIYNELIPKLKISPTTLLLHTSGSLSIEIFSKLTNPYGVFYPLQTFSKDKEVDFCNIPICIEASDNKTYKEIELLSNQISKKVYKISSSERETIHLAAVFANNFVNYIYSCSEEILSSKNIPFEILHPLITETALKAITLSPQKAQTGPAKRSDKKIIEKHIKLLKNNDFKEIYTLLSKQIIDKYSAK